jgi:hypothetical protein
MRRSASAPIASCDLERIDWAVIHHDFRIEFLGADREARLVRE